MASAPSVIEILESLVGYDTVSAKSNLALIDWIADYLAHHGVESALTHDSSGTKANLFATIGPPERGGYILSGHTDVVPVEGQDWQSDPFRLTLRDGRYHGRGAADMKAFIALTLALVPEACARRLDLPLHLAFSFDEEVGCLGVPALIASLPQGAARPILAVIGEPTEMRVANAHKGCHVMRTEVTGLEAHSSRPHEGANAIGAAAEIIGEILRVAESCRDAASADSAFDPPYTSFNIGTIAGGTAFNIIARDCAFGWELRNLPEDDPASLLGRIEAYVTATVLPRLRAIDPRCSVATRPVVSVPALLPLPGSPAEMLARELTGANSSGTIAFATEGGLFQQAGIPAIICGPGSIAQAHKADEYIAVEQIAAGRHFLDRLLARATAPA